MSKKVNKDRTIQDISSDELSAILAQTYEKYIAIQQELRVINSEVARRLTEVKETKDKP